MGNTSIDEVLAFNKKFVAEDRSASFRAGNKPSKKLAVVTCMDTRLITMLQAALGLENGEANIIRAAGAEVHFPYGTVVRSLLIAIYELGVREIMVIAHTECGAQHMNATKMIALMRESGISEEAITEAHKGRDLDAWLEGFGDTEVAVKKSVATIKNHPLVPPYITVKGFIIETQTGELMPVE